MPVWAGVMVHKLGRSFLLGEKPEHRRPICLCKSLESVGVLQLSPLWGFQQCACSELTPSTRELKKLSAFPRVARAPKKAVSAILPLTSTFVHLLFFSFSPSTHNSHMNQSISISWHFEGEKKNGAFIGPCCKTMWHHCILKKTLHVLWNRAALSQAHNVYAFMSFC